MHYLAVSCLVVLCCAGLTRGQAEREKRDADEDLEQLLQSIQNRVGRHDDDDDDRREGMEDFEAEIDNRVYEARNDFVEERRWHEVYADTDNSYNSRAMNSITPAQSKDIVELHNKLRAGEGASNMEKLRWNPKLASLAQSWAQGCRFEHGQPAFSAQDIGHKDLGQNIYSHSDPKFTVQSAVQAWFDEKKDFDYNSLSCSKVCGHYTAVTWAKTTDVGCGLTFCSSISGLTNAHFIVCNYAPAGNFQGEKPFLKGKACTQCDSGKFFCGGNLCDSSCSSPGANCQCKAECQKCGKKTAACKCDCPAGTTGPDCSANCADKDPKCGANPGYPEFMCTKTEAEWAFVKEKCPKMCKKCQPSDGKPCKSREGDQANTLKRLMLGYLQKELDAEEDLE